MVCERPFIFCLCIPCDETFLWFQVLGHLSRSRSNVKVTFTDLNQAGGCGLDPGCNRPKSLKLIVVAFPPWHSGLWE